MKVGRLYCELCVDEKELARRFVERERNDGLLAARAYHPPARWAERMKEREYQPAYRKAKALR